MKEQETHNRIRKWLHLPSLGGIQSTILISFTLVSVIFLLMATVSMYQNFAAQTRKTMTANTERLISQTTSSLEDYLVSMRRLSDALYYNAIREVDLSTGDIDGEMSLLYEANKDNLVSFALFSKNGDLVAASPVSAMKSTVSVTEQSWFSDALDKFENLHFSVPHVQNLFDNAGYRYSWVISLSRGVELTDSGEPTRGVLLVDMNYSTIEQMLDRINDVSSKQYYYLCDSSGKIIYHPRSMEISLNNYRENSAEESQLDDGSHTLTYQKEKRTVVVNTVSYTGWKLIGVIPNSTFSVGMTQSRYYAVLVILLILLMMLLVNRLVTGRISGPIIRLDDSVRRFQAGASDENDIYIGGTTEIRHLGETLKDSYGQIHVLMDDIVVEQEEKRKSELDALQAQINPHFLYNTLDSIVWMIESERNKDAVYMVTQLASFFRLSLSKGKTIIPVKDELQHAKYYLNIQKARFKEQFEATFDVEPEAEACCTVKLIVQPIIENAISYGIREIDDGEIHVHAYIRNGDLFIDISDNGLGMKEEEVRTIFREEGRVHKHGSGVGLVNVHNRIRLRFGERYGLRIKSEPDEGTRIRIHLPAVPYTKANQELLEKGVLPDLVMREDGDEA